MKAQGRLAHLDGVRGLAALVVVISHFFCIFLPEVYFGSTDPDYRVQDALSESPVYVLVNGRFAVSVFFVLSGFVMSMASASTQEGFVQLSGRRILRLSIPMAFSVLVAYSLLIIFPDSSIRANDILDNVWLGQNHPMITDRFELGLWDGLYNTYRYGASRINTPLWSMQIELFGSICIYLLYKTLPRTLIPLGYVVFGVLLLFFVEGRFLYLLGFVFGGLIFEFRKRFEASYWKYSGLLVVSGLCLGGIPTQPAVDSWLNPLVELLKPYTSPDQVILSTGAALILIGVIYSRLAIGFFSHKLLKFLGRISFSLYLIHWPILFTLMFETYLKTSAQGVGLLLLAAGFTVVCIVAAWLMTIFVDEPSVNLLSRYRRHPMRLDAAIISSMLFVGSTIVYIRMTEFHWLLIVVFALGSMGFLFLFNGTISKLASIARR